MIRIFTGDDRVRANKEIRRVLGDDYEVVEGVDLTANDLPSLLKGVTLFAETRNILIRDLSANKEVFEKLPEYLDTLHNVVIFEMKIDKRSATYKAIKDRVEVVDYSLPKDRNLNKVFDIYRVAKRDGKRAVEMLEEIRVSQEPMMFVGLMVSQAIKDYAARQGAAEKKALKELSKLDLDMKSSPVEPWLLIEAFLTRLASCWQTSR